MSMDVSEAYRAHAAFVWRSLRRLGVHGAAFISRKRQDWAPPRPLAVVSTVSLTADATVSPLHDFTGDFAHANRRLPGCA